MDAMSRKPTEIMEIEIKFGKGRSDRVVVHFGDEPTNLAERFVKRHRLKESSVPLIADYIANTIDDFLSKNPQIKPPVEEQPTVSADVAPETLMNETGSGTKSSSSDDSLSSAAEIQCRLPRSGSAIALAVQLGKAVPPGGEQTKLPIMQNQQSRPLPELPDAANSDTTVCRESSPTAAAPNVKHSSTSPRQAQQNEDQQEMKQQSLPRHTPNRMRSMELKQTPEDYLKQHIVSTTMAEETSSHMSRPPGSIRSGGSDSESIISSKPNSKPASRPNSRRLTGGGESIKESELLAMVNDPHMLDHRQFQQVVDRQMNIETFSDEKIVSELVSARTSASPHRDGHSLDVGIGYYHSDTQGLPPHRNDINDENGEDDSAEERYNRLLLEKSNPAEQSIDNDVDETGGVGSSYESYMRCMNDVFYKGVSRKSALKPSSKVLQLGAKKQLAVQSEARKQGAGKAQLAGKSANERLYMTAQLVQRKKHLIEQRKQREEEEVLKKEMFKVNENSQHIVDRTRHTSSKPITLRLHEDGEREKILKNKRCNDLQGRLVRHEWSCARCGMFHKTSTAGVVIQPLHQVNSASRVNDINYQRDTTNEETIEKLCSNCGWNQGAVKEFHPTNVGLELLENAEEDDLCNRLQQKKTQQHREDDDGGIHEYLYSNAAQRENFQQLNRVLWEENNPDLKFAPTIPESSERILDNYKQRSVTGKSADDETEVHQVDNIWQHDMVVPEEVHHKGNKLAGAALGKYIRQPATKRLSATPAREFSALQREHDDDSTMASSSTRQKNSGSQKEYVDKLVYEYRSKDERLMKRIQEANTIDPVTGQRLFTPQVGPSPESQLNLGHAISNGQGRDIVQTLYEKERLSQERKKVAREKVLRKRDDELRAAQQVKALGASADILRAATERNIEELYQVLLENHPPAVLQIDPDDEIREEDKWKKQVLLLNEMDTGFLIEEVARLVDDVLREHIDTMHKTVASDDGEEYIEFSEFRDILLKLLNRRNGVGKGYVNVPRKRPGLAMQMVQVERQQETFRPSIDRKSRELSERRRRQQAKQDEEHVIRGNTIQDILHTEGERARAKLEAVRREKILREADEYTFHPVLYKPPAHVTPRYRGMGNDGIVGTSSPPNAQNKSVPKATPEEPVEVDKKKESDATMGTTSMEATEVQIPPNQSSSVSPKETATPIDQEHEEKYIPNGLRIRQCDSEGRNGQENEEENHQNDDESYTDITVNTISTKFTLDLPDATVSGHGTNLEKSRLPPSGRHVGHGRLEVQNNQPTINQRQPAGIKLKATSFRTTITNAAVADGALDNFDNSSSSNNDRKAYKSEIVSGFVKNDRRKSTGIAGGSRSGISSTDGSSKPVSVVSRTSRRENGSTNKGQPVAVNRRQVPPPLPHEVQKKQAQHIAHTEVGAEEKGGACEENNDDELPPPPPPPVPPEPPITEQPLGSGEEELLEELAMLEQQQQQYRAWRSERFSMETASTLTPDSTPGKTVIRSRQDML